ncbi:acyltransferase [Leptospira yanagawae serovar Saopaulo str. Sao Paulo = ATCC 700523]|uniref:Acyltransferase n=1 Tax=Leptospira yanagawae serovar Saopaulo str. Sao Paulo = ATCC 700523 TaxID=1249483 RepID=A0A5E8H9Y7_9LEPT|nr:acyltransferase [Leptospira yanagawae]EOQ87460.1 acyltransferase [Leptospira yanagawae serovar Saopaulo str. Sao Paulo = ATCC 700523]
MKDYLFSVFKTNPLELKGLNGIRGIAFFMVIYTHMFRPYKYFGFYESNVWIENFLNNGSLCMDAFFVLSGYLIGGQLLKEKIKTNVINYGNFLTKRVLRIFPPYYIFLTFQFIFIYQLSKHATDELVRTESAQLVHRVIWDYTYMSDYFAGIMIHGWSLSVEEKFYILLPILLFLILKLKQPKQILISLSTLVILPTIMRYVHFSMINPENLNFGTYTGAFYYPFHSRMDGLFLGVLIAAVQIYFPEWINRFLKNKYSPYAVLLSISSLFSIMFFTTEDRPELFTCVFRFFVASIAWSVVLIKTFDEKTWTSKVLSIPVFSPVAKLSYCAYIIHLLLLGYLSKKFIGYHKIHYYEIFLWTIPIGVMILGYAYFYYLLTEKPFLALRNRILAQKKVG